MTSGIRRRRRWVANLAALGTGCVAAILVAEVLLRLTGLGSPSPLVPYERLPFKRRPDLEFTNRREIVNPVRLNSWGFHDRDRTRTSDSYRLLALGDSFVEGLQVTVEDLFTSRIEARLRSTGLDVEVLNAGMGGVGTGYQYLLYEDFFCDRIDVDHVLLFLFNGNDLPNNHPVLEQRIHRNDAGGRVFLDAAGRVYVVARDQSPRQRIMAWTDRHLAVSYTIHKAAYELEAQARSRRAQRGQAQPSPAQAPSGGSSHDPAEELGAEWSEAVTGTLALLRRWHEELDVRGVGFSIVVLPAADHLLAEPYGNRHKARFVRQLVALGEEVGFGVLPLQYGGHEPGEIFTFDGVHYGHYLPAGHGLVGKAVADWLHADLDASLSAAAVP